MTPNLPDDLRAQAAAEINNFLNVQVGLHPEDVLIINEEDLAAGQLLRAQAAAEINNFLNGQVDLGPEDVLMEDVAQLGGDNNDAGEAE